MTSDVTMPVRGICASVIDAAHMAMAFVDTIQTEYENARETFVEYANQTLPGAYAYIVERISNAVPEIFAAIGGLYGGILVIPALAISWGQKIPACMPFILTVLHGEFGEAELARSLRVCGENFSTMFDEKVVPALFVAMAVDTVISGIIGTITMNFASMLRVTRISFPVTILAGTYMLRQRHQSEHLGPK